MTKRLCDKGYTLIELVVSMLLFSLVMLAVTGGIHFGARVWERSQRDLQEANTLDMTQNVLREILSRAAPRFRGEYVSFSGEPGSLTFDGLPPSAFGGGGMVHVKLSVIKTNGASDLLLDLQSITEPKLEKKATLRSGSDALQFSYLDASETKPVWLSYWRDRNRLPDAIRIAAGNDAPSWPTLLVRLIIAQDANCVMDPVSMKCRGG
jgi:general secretion pathway protein J